MTASAPTVAWTALCLALGATAAPSTRSNTLWIPTGPAAGHSTTITVQVTLPQSTRDRLHETFVAVSTPGDARYGKHLSFDELNELVRVPDATREAASEWCTTRQFTCKFVGTGDLLRVTADAGDLGAELGVNLEIFEHPTNGMKIVRTRTAVDLPPNMTSWASSVMGINTFPNLVRAPHSPNVATPVTPSLLKSATLYSITDTASADSKSSMAVAEFQGQGYLPTDLAKFETKFGLPSQTVRNVSGDPKADKKAGTEAELDIQYIIATGTGVPADFYLHPGQDFDLPGWAGVVLGDPNTALVWSVSYGEGINGGVGGVIQPSYASALNMQFEKFGVRGISVLIASGDSGVYNREPITPHEKFHPSFPSCLPAATSVGATQLDAGPVEDSGVSFSGGGFTPANYFERDPNCSWQDAAVQAYLNSGVKMPDSDLFNAQGRGLPDVSAVGVDFLVIQLGLQEGVSGTSASTPAVAGIIALINDKLMAEGKSSLGFLNPWFYKNPGMFRDITKGYNNGGGLGLFKSGFYATTGWDPVTGLGTPNYPAMKAAAFAAAGL